ncbi:hypothetical protein [Nostoc sp.]|uniref:hypothetical protein n=1 Tax=Nostoc sp. TaxID=1180 RepID=UPI002FF9AD1B
MNKFANALLLALVFAAPVTVFASQAQAAVHKTSVKGAKHHYRHHRHHHTNVVPKTNK